MIKKIESFIELLKRDYPRSNPVLETFPSGAAMLNLNVGMITYVMEYLPSQKGFGVSRMDTATFGWEGVEASFDTFDDTAKYLLGLLKRD